MESMEPSSQDSQLDDAAQPTSKKRKLDHLNASTDGSGPSFPSARVSQVPPRARAKPQRPRYPHLHSEPPSLLPLSNTPSATHTGATSTSESQTHTAACVGYKIISPNDHEHAVDTKLGLLLQQVHDVQAETERCRAETDRRRVERERELERSFEQRRVQREREFEITTAQRKEELKSSFAQREKELEREFSLSVTRLKDQLRLSEKEGFMEGAKLSSMLLQQGHRLRSTASQLSEAEHHRDELRTQLHMQQVAHDGLEQRFRDTEEKLRQAEQELVNVQTHRNALLHTLSLVVVEEREESRVLHQYLFGSDAPASGDTANVTAHSWTANDSDETTSTTSPAFARRYSVSSDSDSGEKLRFSRIPLRRRSLIPPDDDSDGELRLTRIRRRNSSLIPIRGRHRILMTDDDSGEEVRIKTIRGRGRPVITTDDESDGESRFMRNSHRPLRWQRSPVAISFPRPYDLPLSLSTARGERAAVAQSLRARHDSATEEARELQEHIDRQSVDHDEALQAIKKEQRQTQANLAKLRKMLDNALVEKTKLESVVETQKGFEQEARRNQERSAELGARLMTERRIAVKIQEKLTSELESTRATLAAVQESLTSAKDRRNDHALRLAAARREVEEVREELEKLKSAVGPQRQHPQPERGSVRIHRTTTRGEATEAGLQVGYLDPMVAKLQRECEVRRSATKHFRSRALQAEATFVRFHLGVGIVSSTLREMLKDLKWPKKVKDEDEDEDDNSDTHDLWDVVDAYKRMLDKYGEVLETIPDKEDYYGDLGCPLCPPEME